MNNQNQHCAVIIPVFNNAQQLPLTLPALFGQSIPSHWQISAVLSDDGSTDESLITARRLCHASSWPYQIISSPHAGAGTARNHAIAQSSSSLLLFLGADIVLRPGSLMAHLNFHSHYPDAQIAALGFVVWDPRLHPTPLMEWMTHGGSQNNFDALLGQAVADPNHYFYGSHLSLKRSVLPSPPFRPQYNSYGWEDIDLGRRLAAQKNLQLSVLPEAIGHHYHYYSTQRVLDRQQAAGHGFRLFQSQHPSVAVPKTNSLSHWFKHALIYYSGLLFIIRQITKIISPKYSLPLIYKIAINSHFWYGFYHTYPQK
ncbi:MAG: hypothetical protein A3E37_00915 [Candidatus Andersenbacteria bacterium RIFCSPHIGHO2_12_FULL_46_9]|nr:MAG: hypothetical protein UW94_C0001G0101 [Parcubacteria group bacterium GW2011_GWA2_45_14]OGY35756.1 MAG: hypothetical protein A3B76_03525 [Candidatus Andersenbacteria bacterium RIFCSPHIGHO2_02_FULL_46_16]OGY37487.1 MAG: hypothetical protein A3I08_00445 [Candidatus Andersenbacteria bacterium RIFCSPLOWO2_02_FULL_46_11]OGY37969.1 MAG: hypothetical protein A3E37_00915 [Candidatus Andersenbacteria bacterium RIFCSPHIGHO2_12_FULL_46_9]HBE90159.1 hypothetical protein [Candidatus Andersenbacteria b